MPLETLVADVTFNVDFKLWRARHANLQEGGIWFLSAVVLSDIVSGMLPLVPAQPLPQTRHVLAIGKTRHPPIESCFALGLDAGTLAREFAAPGARNARPAFSCPPPPILPAMVAATGKIRIVTECSGLEPLQRLYSDFTATCARICGFEPHGVVRLTTAVNENSLRLSLPQGRASSAGKTLLPIAVCIHGQLQALRDLTFRATSQLDRGRGLATCS